MTSKDRHICVKACGHCATAETCMARRDYWERHDRAMPPGKPYEAAPEHQSELAAWEQQMREDAVRQLLNHTLPQDQFTAEGKLRAGLEETPARVAKAWAFWTQGYHQDPAALLKTFEDGAEGIDEMVRVGPIELYSHCEHHLAPFFGEAWIAYIPNGKIVGLSKLARVADVFARRLQVQERLTKQIADCIEEALQPLGVAVLIEAKHFCMCSRGVQKQNASTRTTTLRGAFRNDPAARAEFLASVRRA